MRISILVLTGEAQSVADPLPPRVSPPLSRAHAENRLPRANWTADTVLTAQHCPAIAWQNLCQYWQLRHFWRDVVERMVVVMDILVIVGPAVVAGFIAMCQNRTSPRKSFDAGSGVSRARSQLELDLLDRGSKGL